MPTPARLRPSRRQLIARLGAGAVALGTAGWYGLRQSSSPAPEAPYTLLDGSTHRLSGLRGRVVLVDFWATTCAICLREMPQLIATHQRYAPLGLQTLAVAMPYDPPARVIDYAQQHALPFGVVIDNQGELSRVFGPIEGTPTTLLVDRRGAVALRQVGTPDFVALHQRIEQLLTAA